MIGAIICLVGSLIGIPYFSEINKCNSICLSRKHPIVFVSTRDGNPELYKAERLYVKERLTNNYVPDINPRISWDRKKIAFLSLRNGNWGVYTCNMDGSEQKKIADVSNPDHCFPDWSPDGKWIGWADGGSLKFYNNEKNTILAMASDDGVMCGIRFSGDLSKIYFGNTSISKYSYSNYHLASYCIEKKESTIEKSLEKSMFDTPFDVSPYGNEVVLADSSNSNKIVTLVNNGIGWEVIETELRGINPTFSPDARRIAYSRKYGSSNDLDIVIYDTLTKKEILLTAYDGNDYQAHWR